MTEAKPPTVTKRWFYDTEFNEDGQTIDLISIALVCEDGREYYAVSSEFRAELCSLWVRQNVLPHLPDEGTWKPRAQIAEEIRLLLLADGAKPELWAYFGDYDHVALCQLYGRMIDLPEGFPFLTLDLKQRMKERGVSKEQLPPQSGTEHDALADARWNREAWLALEQTGFLAGRQSVEGEAGGGWIACSDELPDSDVPVLLADAGQLWHEVHIGELEFTDDGEGHGKPYWATHRGDWPILAFTHWRPLGPLPPPPKGTD